MKVIRNSAKLPNNYLGRQKINENTNYRKINYSFETDIDSGCLLYNKLTDEMVLLSNEEKLIVDKKLILSPVFRALIEKWFFVPENFDEANICIQLTEIEKNIFSTCSENYINNYIILPTTDCNARCFYCYERGIKKKNMSMQTASDIADFIVKSSNGKRVLIYWFGGEPLYNQEAIDKICTYLRDNNIVFSSKMISNGYLFDSITLEKAKNIWNLKSVQITIDGTEKIYNRIKSYIYKNTNPFKRVIDNVRNLLQNNIAVNVRMNMDKYNCDDLYNLTDFLVEQFSSFNKFKLYAHLLFEDTDDTILNRNIEVKNCLVSKFEQLNEYIESKGVQVKNTLDDYYSRKTCIASDDHSTIISPDGNLGMCEHFPDSEFYGSIYSTKKDYEIIKKYKQLRSTNPDCRRCPLLPGCIKLVHCPLIKRDCDERMLHSFYKNLKKRMINTYNEYLKSENNN